MKLHARLLLAVPLFVAAGLAGAAEGEYDLLLRNARIVDGTGAPWYRGDIAIRGDTIARVGPSIASPARRTIDLKDMVAAPGFIDIHTEAFSAILVSNVTTFIAGVVLFVFGTGAIKGFAIVLSLGILTSMFSALMGSRALLTLMFGGNKKLTKLPIG